MKEYYCDVCNKAVKLKNEKKHLTTKSRKDLSMCVVSKKGVKDRKFYKIETIIQIC